MFCKYETNNDAKLTYKLSATYFSKFLTIKASSFIDPREFFLHCEFHFFENFVHVALKRFKFTDKFNCNKE